jgi:hypothetical protein
MAALTALTIAGAVATVGGGIAKFQQGRGVADAFQEQSRVAIAKGNIERFQLAQETERVRKSATAQAGIGGGSLSGSMLENLNRSMTNAQLDEEMITYNAQVASNNFIQQGRNARAAGQAALMSSIGSAAVSLGGLGGGVENMGQVKTGSLAVKPSVKPI